MVDTSNFVEQASEQPVVLTGHYGSGKTEIAVNLAMLMADTESHVAVIDLDIANPYFRSREAERALGSKGVRLVSNAYGYDIAADLPALSAGVKSFLKDDAYRCVVDVGGNDSGARVLTQYGEELESGEATFFIVVNVFRPETDTTEKIIGMIRSIENETGHSIDGIINNSNLLRETGPWHVVRGYQVLQGVSFRTGIPIVAHCAEKSFAWKLKGKLQEIVPLNLFMRPVWLDM